jgi:hypothetical protein
MIVQHNDCEEAVSLTIFQYLYHDASNYKSFGSLYLTGTLTEADRRELISCLDGDELFVAEQVEIPALYSDLFQFGGGPTDDDHAWHEFDGFRDHFETTEEVRIWGDAPALLAAFRVAKGSWRPELSPNFLQQSAAPK